MVQNTSVSLDAHFADFLSREVASGRRRSGSEVVRAGLRLLEDHETHLARLRAALVAGEDSGTPETLTSTPSSRRGTKDNRLTPAAQRDLSGTSQKNTGTQDRLRSTSPRSARRLSLSRWIRHAVAPAPRSATATAATGIESHLFYVETTASVDIVRILHQRMNPTRHL
jgi:antitoxin ParD1/3/4